MILFKAMILFRVVRKLLTSCDTIIAHANTGYCMLDKTQIAESIEKILAFILKRIY